MNAPFIASIADATEADHYDQLRIQMLDAFYELDEALEDWIFDGKGKAAGASTGCRLKELTAIDFPDSVATKAQAKRLANLTNELDEAIKVRNIVIHSKASFGTVDGVATIFLKPISYRNGGRDLFVHKTFEHLNDAINMATSVAKSISGWRRHRDTKSASGPNSPPASGKAAISPQVIASIKTRDSA